VVYELLNEPIGDLDCCHKCDVRDCCRPEHLFVGTRSENMLDMSAKGRHFNNKTHCIRGHEFDAENTRIYIREGLTERYCRACARIRQEKYKKSPCLTAS
jgi:hypothetical protein